MKKTNKTEMKFFLFLCHWGLLFILIASFLAALFWEENLPVKSGDHILMAIGIVVVFYYLLYRWNYIYETSFANTRHHRKRMNPEKLECQIDTDRSSEKI